MEGVERPIRVMASGVFDLIHLGHLHYLEEAKTLGDELWVVVACDETVKKHKHTPIMNEKMRLELVNALKPVKKAVLGHPSDIFEVVKEIKPDIIAIGWDQTFDEKNLARELKKRGLDIKVVRMPRRDTELDGTRRIIYKIEELLEKKKLYKGTPDREDDDASQEPDPDVHREADQ